MNLWLMKKSLGVLPTHDQMAMSWARKRR